jgi:hypothetical protein
MNRAEDSTYCTDHLYLAAFLSCSGHGVIGTSSDGSRISFVFNQTLELSAAVAAFMSGAHIPARRFSFEVLKLKRLIPRSKQKMGIDKTNGSHDSP